MNLVNKSGKLLKQQDFVWFESKFSNTLYLELVHSKKIFPVSRDNRKKTLGCLKNVFLCNM